MTMNAARIERLARDPRGDLPPITEEVAGAIVRILGNELGTLPSKFRLLDAGATAWLE